MFGHNFSAGGVTSWTFVSAIFLLILYLPIPTEIRNISNRPELLHLCITCASYIRHYVCIMSTSNFEIHVKLCCKVGHSLIEPIQLFDTTTHNTPTQELTCWLFCNIYTPHLDRHAAATQPENKHETHSLHPTGPTSFREGSDHPTPDFCSARNR